MSFKLHLLRPTPGTLIFALLLSGAAPLTLTACDDGHGDIGDAGGGGGCGYT